MLGLGDVPGHGIGPALLAAECRAYARALLCGGPSLARDVGRLSSAIPGDLTEGRFITFAAVDVDPPAAAVSVLSAGHGPILLYRAATRDVRELPSQGLPLGLGEADGYEPAVDLPMASGDALLVLSDGVHEAANPSGEQLGVSRVKQIIADAGGPDAAELVQLLVEAAQRFAGGDTPKDDLTAVVVRKT